MYALNALFSSVYCLFTKWLNLNSFYCGFCVEKNPYTKFMVMKYFNFKTSSGTNIQSTSAEHQIPVMISAM